MAYNKKPKLIDRKEAFRKACNYCAYQERLQEDVRLKLKSMKISSDEEEEIIAELILHNFINEERYAKAYSGGKFRIKKWGKLKIIRNLEIKGVSPYCIKKGLDEIPNEDYMKTLEQIIISKKEQYAEEDLYVLKHKLSEFAKIKGYEPELIWSILSNYK